MVQLLFFISTSAAFFGDVADEVALLNCERLGICPGETLDLCLWSQSCRQRKLVILFCTWRFRFIRDYRWKDEGSVLVHAHSLWNIAITRKPSNGRLALKSQGLGFLFQLVNSASSLGFHLAFWKLAFGKIATCKKWQNQKSKKIKKIKKTATSLTKRSTTLWRKGW